MGPAGCCEKTPFMTMTFLEASTHLPIDIFDLQPGEHAPLSYAALQEVLHARLTSPNLFHAILVRGRFHSIKARAVRKQLQPRGLLEVARDQAVFEFHDEEGCLVGFYSPPFVGSSIAVPG